jgi:hypothetical protein
VSDSYQRPSAKTLRWVEEALGSGARVTAVARLYGEPGPLQKVRCLSCGAVYERPGGFSATASKTVAVPVERLFDAFMDDGLRERWLPGGDLRLRTASRPKSARFDWGDGTTRVNVGFTAKGEGKSSVGLEHERLVDGAEAERMKAYWRERVAVLKKELEG